MNDKLTFQEKLLKHVKKHKKKTKKHVFMVIPILLIILLINAIYTPFVPTVADTDDDLITATFVGDIMMGRNVEKVIDHEGIDYLFEHVEPYLKASDYVTGNFENPLLLSDEKDYVKADKLIHLHAHEESVSTLKEMNFSVLNIANNHGMDFKEKGLLDTQKAFANEDLDLVGFGENLADAQDNISIQEVNGYKVATLGFTDVYTNEFPVSKRVPGVLVTDPEVMIPMIHEAREQADFVFVHIHWGVEYDDSLHPRQEKLAEAISRAGADVIIGHHPHVLSSVDLIGDTVMFTSLGNFIFDQGWSRTRQSVLAQMKWQEDGIARFELLPLKIRESRPAVLGKMSLVDRSKTFRQLTKNSDHIKFSKDDGKLVFEIDFSDKLKEND
ncbi:MAG TPA: CapA family protein [Bacillota bacterium]